MKKTGTFLFFVMGMLLLDAQTKQQLAEAKKQEKLKMKYVFWEDCFIVKPTGDTVFGKLKPGDYDISCTHDDDLLGDLKLRIAYSDGREESFRRDQFVEIFLCKAHPEFQHFVILPGDEHVWRVVVEGPCKLLNRETRFQISHLSINTTQVGIGGTGTTEMRETGPGEEHHQHYALYYQNLFSLTKAHKQSFNIDEAFAKQCQALFSFCPSLQSQLSNKQLTDADLKEIANTINKCK